MHLLRNNVLSRRNLVAGMLGFSVISPSETFAARQTNRPASVDVGGGMEIRDYRLFPTKDVMRFIVEIHNTTDTAVDTPAMGVVLPHQRDDNWGWAGPASQVLNPHSSDCLIGIAPAALVSDADWGKPDWILCNDIKTHRASSRPDWNIEVTHRIEISDSRNAQVTFEITNRNDHKSTGWFHLQGLVRDQDDRLCGALRTWSIPWAMRELGPGEQITGGSALNPGADYIANPFPLLETVEGITVDFSVQRQIPVINPSCSAVMPWNRHPD